MDNRHLQIRERAGLEESRLNLEFVDWLRKWSTPLLLVVAALTLGYVAYQRWTIYQSNRVNDAFKELENTMAGASPNPESLRAIAAEFEGVESVPELARLHAGDIYLDAVRRGVKIGIQPNPDGTLADPSAAVNSDIREMYLGLAQEMYEDVARRAQGKTSKTLLAISAQHGLAAVAESRGQIEQAKAAYERVIALTEGTAYAMQARLARERIESLASIAQPLTLPSAADLPKDPVTVTEPAAAGPPPAAEPIPAAPATPAPQP